MRSATWILPWLCSFTLFGCTAQPPTVPTDIVDSRSSAKPFTATAPQSWTTSNVHDASGVWCATTQPGELGAGSPGGCGDLQLQLTQHANQVTSSVFFDDGENQYRADFEFVRRGPGRFHHLLTVTITVLSGSACNPVAVFTGDADIDTVAGLLTGTADGTNTDCIHEVQQYSLARQ